MVNRFSQILGVHEVVRVLEDKAFLPGDYVVRVGEVPRKTVPHLNIMLPCSRSLMRCTSSARERSLCLLHKESQELIRHQRSFESAVRLSEYPSPIQVQGCRGCDSTTHEARSSRMPFAARCFG